MIFRRFTSPPFWWPQKDRKEIWGSLGEAMKGSEAGALRECLVSYRYLANIIKETPTYK